jgi:hypothetical protein
LGRERAGFEAIGAGGVILSIVGHLDNPSDADSVTDSFMKNVWANSDRSSLSSKDVAGGVRS